VTPAVELRRRGSPEDLPVCSQRTRLKLKDEDPPVKGFVAPSPKGGWISSAEVERAGVRLVRRARTGEGDAQGQQRAAQS